MGLEQLLDKFAAMKPGQSFFVAGASRHQLRFFTVAAQKQGLGCAVRDTACDEIYQTKGVRVWRQKGEYDEL